MQQTAGAVDEGTITEGAAVECRFGEGAVSKGTALEFFIESRFPAPVESLERLPDKFISGSEWIGASGRDGRWVIDDRLPAASAS
jgi:hypothetical protein